MPKQRGDTGKTYPGAHEGNLLVIEAVHSAGEAGSAPGPLSIDAGTGRGSRAGSGRCAAGGGVEESGGWNQALAGAVPEAGSIGVRFPGEPVAAPAVAGRSPPARDVTQFL